MASSLRACAAEVLERWDRLDVLALNAGGILSENLTTEDGIEMTFGVNHLGHALLTDLLPDRLAASAPARVVVTASLAHRMALTGMTWSQLEQRRNYVSWQVYGESKLANILFAFELQRHAARHSSPLVSNAAHPGVAATNLVASEQGLGSIPGIKQLAPFFMSLLFQSAEAGADPVLYAAAEAGPATYSGPQRLRESRGPAGPAKLSRHARDDCTFWRATFMR